MPAVEFIQRFTKLRTDSVSLRPPAFVVLEFGGSCCNKAGTASCKDICALPKGQVYDAEMDPTADMIAEQFQQMVLLKPAAVSLVPNGEAVLPYQESNTPWSDVLRLKEEGKLTVGQAKRLTSYSEGRLRMSVAEKTALIIALGKNVGLNLSLTSNGSFLNKELLRLYKDMGLGFMNLSYHPNKPFNPDNPDSNIKHLVAIANEAIEAGIIPTIAHVLTRENADTIVALCDYVTGEDIFFSVGIANTLGGGFSSSKKEIEPTDEQVKTVFRRLLARKLFSDRHIRSTIPYLLMAPYLRHWICGETTDFFHISFDKRNGNTQPGFNVCSDMRAKNPVCFEDFLKDGVFDTDSYLKWRSGLKKDCSGCTSQCYFESETRGTLNIGQRIESWDWWDSFGKGFRQRYTFRHPIRPVVSKGEDFQNPYLWESLLQGIARIMAGLKDNQYWQETFKRSEVSYVAVLQRCIADALNAEVVNELVAAESAFFNWHDAKNFQSRFLRALYLPFQRSGKEANIAIPLKFQEILRHESKVDFEASIKSILKAKREETLNIKKTILNIVKRVNKFLDYLYNWLWVPRSSNITVPLFSE